MKSDTKHVLLADLIHKVLRNNDIKEMTDQHLSEQFIRQLLVEGFIYGLFVGIIVTTLVATGIRYW